MTKGATVRADFPLPAVCPACDRDSVMVTMRHPSELPEPEAVIEISIECVCGRVVNFGGLPAQVSHE